MSGTHPYRLFFLFFLLKVTGVSAHSLTDTTKYLLAEKEAAYCTEVYKANVIFPELFSGNETRMCDYILQFAQNRRAYIIRMYEKSKRYFGKISGIFNKHGVPEEFRVLMVLESACSPHAVSKAGAVGFWQFMDAPAKEYGLKIVPNQRPGKKLPVHYVKGKKVKATDDRSHFTKSTYAAAKYLRDRSKNLNNNWLLIAASYNWGIGNVWDAMKKTGLESPTYWDIEKYVPAETKFYVLNFITLNVLFQNYDAFLSEDLRFEDKEVKLLLTPVLNDFSEKEIL